MQPNTQCEIPLDVKPDLKPFDSPADDFPSDVSSSAPPVPATDDEGTVGLAPTLARMPSLKPDALVDAQVGEYKVLGRIGAGGMGLVYEAVQPLIGKRVAIKVLRPEYASDAEQMGRLLAEARAVNAVGHRGIIDIFAFGQLADGRHYFVMEFLQGESLEDYLLRSGAIPEAQAFGILDEILSALSAAHAAGVVHRDLKPSNVYLVPQPSGTPYVKLLDFGLAKVAPSANGASPQTRADMVVGTPEYMAPEQARALPVGPQTDLYALGVLAYQMVAGKLPFTGMSAIDIVMKHVDQKPTPPSTLAPKLHRSFEAVILQLLAKRAEDRPNSAEHTRDLFRAALNQPATATPPPQPLSITAAATAAAAPSMRMRAPSSRLLFFAGAPVALLIGGFVALWGVKSEPPQPIIVIQQAAATTPPVTPPVTAEADREVAPVIEAAKVDPEPVVVAASARIEKSQKPSGPSRASLFARIKRLDATMQETAGRSGMEADPTAKLLLNSARNKIRRAKDGASLRDAAKYLDEWEAKYLSR